MTVYNLLKLGGIKEPSDRICSLVGNVVKSWAVENNVESVKVEQVQGETTYIVNDYKPLSTSDMEIVALDFIIQLQSKK